jgi:predicted MFS family arabinose efflux permease
MEIENKEEEINSNARVLNLVTFFCLYIAQSVPSSFLATALQVLMREAHYSLATIGLLQLVKLPWIIKFLWSPLVDRNCLTVADYKRCIVSSELAYAVLLFLTTFLSVDTDIYWILTLVTLSLAASATQDIATDALAVLAFHSKERSMVNSMQSMGQFGGVIVGSGLLIMVLHSYGWRTVVPCLSAFVLLALTPLVLNRHIKIEQREKRNRARLTDFVWFFATPGIWRQVGFLILYYAGIIGILSMLRPYMVDLGYTMKEIGFLLGIVGTAAAFVASYVAGRVVRRFGIHKSRIAFAVCVLLTTMHFYGSSLYTPSRAAIVASVCLLWACYGMATIVVFTSSMQCVRKGREGTDFTVQTVITHLSSMLLAIGSGSFAQLFGYSTLFLTETVIAAASLCYVVVVFKNETTPATPPPTPPKGGEKPTP